MGSRSLANAGQGDGREVDSQGGRLVTRCEIFSKYLADVSYRLTTRILRLRNTKEGSNLAQRT